jgi:hypothetical protein
MSASSCTKEARALVVVDMDFTSHDTCYNHCARERALSGQGYQGMAPPAAHFEAELQRQIASLREQGVSDPGTALQNAYWRMHDRTDKHARVVENAIQTCAVNHVFCQYYVEDKCRLHNAFAQYAECAEFCNPERHLSAQSSSALASLQCANPNAHLSSEWQPPRVSPRRARAFAASYGLT